MRSNNTNTSIALKKILGQNLTFSLRAFVNRRPRIYFNIMPFLQKDLSIRVDRDTEMVIAGIWGSANTFAAAAFAHSQPGMPVSHHLHIPAQVIRAAQYKIPCLVLIRHPIDAIASLISKNFLVSKNFVEYSIDGFRWALKDYAYYYESIIGYRNHYVVAEFKEVVTNYPASIERVNEKFGTHFQVPENDSDEAKQLVDIHKTSDDKRPYPIEDVKEFLHAPELAEYRARAENAYENFCTANDVPMRQDTARPPIIRCKPKEAPATR